MGLFFSLLQLWLKNISTDLLFPFFFPSVETYTPAKWVNQSCLYLATNTSFSEFLQFYITAVLPGTYCSFLLWGIPGTTFSSFASVLTWSCIEFLVNVWHVPGPVLGARETNIHVLYSQGIHSLMSSTCISLLFFPPSPCGFVRGQYEYKAVRIHIILMAYIIQAQTGYFFTNLFYTCFYITLPDICWPNQWTFGLGED